MMATASSDCLNASTRNGGHTPLRGALPTLRIVSRASPSGMAGTSPAMTKRRVRRTWMAGTGFAALPALRLAPVDMAQCAPGQFELPVMVPSIGGCHVKTQQDCSGFSGEFGPDGFGCVRPGAEGSAKADRPAKIGDPEVRDPDARSG